MAKKITVRIDDELALKLDELSEKTQIPKVRLAKQAYALLIACYNQLKETYDEDLVDINFIDFLRPNHTEKKKRKN
jgi:predicted transcriptional regulator